jgi:hypothetical protein
MASFAVKGMCIQSAGATNEIRLDVEKVEERQSDQAKTIGSGMLLPKLLLQGWFVTMKIRFWIFFFFSSYDN